MLVIPKGKSRVPCACACGWDASGALELVDRWLDDYPPIPYVRMIQVHAGDETPETTCPRCGAELDEETVLLRVTVGPGGERGLVADLLPGYVLVRFPDRTRFRSGYVALRDIQNIDDIVPYEEV